jgi:hypothetical protein
VDNNASERNFLDRISSDQTTSLFMQHSLYDLSQDVTLVRDLTKLASPKLQLRIKEDLIIRMDNYLDQITERINDMANTPKGRQTAERIRRTREMCKSLCFN